MRLETSCSFSWSAATHPKHPNHKDFLLSYLAGSCWNKTHTKKKKNQSPLNTPDRSVNKVVSKRRHEYSDSSLTDGLQSCLLECWTCGSGKFWPSLMVPYNLPELERTYRGTSFSWSVHRCLTGFQSDSWRCGGSMSSWKVEPLEASSSGALRALDQVLTENPAFSRPWPTVPFPSSCKDPSAGGPTVLGCGDGTGQVLTRCLISSKQDTLRPESSIFGFISCQNLGRYGLKEPLFANAEFADVCSWGEDSTWPFWSSVHRTSGAQPEVLGHLSYQDLYHQLLGLVKGQLWKESWLFQTFFRSLVLSSLLQVNASRQSFP